MLSLFPGSDQEEARPGKLQTPFPPTALTPIPTPALIQAFPFTDPKLSRPAKSQRGCQAWVYALGRGGGDTRAGLSGGSQRPEQGPNPGPWDSQVGGPSYSGSALCPRSCQEAGYMYIRKRASTLQPWYWCAPERDKGRRTVAPADQAPAATTFPSPDKLERISIPWRKGMERRPLPWHSQCTAQDPETSPGRARGRVLPPGAHGPSLCSGTRRHKTSTQSASFSAEGTRDALCSRTPDLVIGSFQLSPYPGDPSPWARKPVSQAALGSQRPDAATGSDKQAPGSPVGTADRPGHVVRAKLPGLPAPSSGGRFGR